jgi:hypothetical protein
VERDELIRQIVDTWRRHNAIIALEQSGMRLPEAVAMRGLWGGWIFGR